MGCILLYSTKHLLTHDIMSGNPNKKIKLDIPNKNDGNVVNEDLWGQDDLTAEEFDMLEIQATQAINKTINFPSHNNQVSSDAQKDLIQASDLKLLQYELEGRIKLLSQSLEKCTKELNEERLNREKIISDRTKEFQIREVNLQKEVEKVQSILEFKEQEMKSVCSKLQILKSQMPDKKISCAEIPMNKNFDDMLNSFKPYNYDDKVSNITKKFHRKHKLVLDSPQGETESTDILSSILCNRLPIFPTNFSLDTSLNYGYSEDNLRNCTFSSMSVVQLKNGQESYELLEYYSHILSNHVKNLKLLSSKCHAVSSSKNSPLSARQKETLSQTVTSCLQDVICLFSSPKLHPIIKKVSNTSKCPVVDDRDNVSSEENNKKSTSPDKVLKENNMMDFSADLNTSTKDFSLLLESLLSLANPSTFPDEYSKNQEMELSLSSLLTICSLWPEEFLDHVSELPLYSLLTSPNSPAVVTCTTLKLMCVLSSCKNFILLLTHKDSNCLWCSVSTLLCNITSHSLENSCVSMILVEDFLSSVLLDLNFSVIQSRTAHCISKVIQDFIICLWKYFQIKEQSDYRIVIIKKGFLLLHFVSSWIPNFKLLRNSVEDEYISFISGLLILSKENSEFREFYDLIHDLWDFQTDISEFDIEELPDETLMSTKEMDVEE